MALDEMLLAVRALQWQTDPMTETMTRAKTRYDVAAPKWGDKMRTLGYYDGYLGFLSAPNKRSFRDARVIDVGAGTASFAEAWVAVNGAPGHMTLLDPSRAMLDRGRASLERRSVEPRLVQELLGETELEPFDVVLAAHVIEHCPDPSVALEQLREILLPGGKLHLVVSKPHWCSAIIWLQWRHRTFREEEILKLVQQAGFDIERVHNFPSGPPSRTSRGIVARRQG
ncbi:MAG: methyltransferase domain-containing protein [Paracoccaceae bacterium]|nr:methyltransferase domain-containing protein [Paracoccaceae bacterium]